MNISIKMLKIVTIILWLIIVFFSITSVFSVMNMGITIGQVEMLPSSRGITFSLPFTINNGGYYEIADLNMTTRVTDPDGCLVDVSKTIILSIPQGSNITASHDVSIDLDNILSLNRESLLLEDGDFNVQVFAGSIPYPPSLDRGSHCDKYGQQCSRNTLYCRRTAKMPYW